MDDKIMKQVSENEDTAIKLLKENVKLKSIIKEVRELANKPEFSMQQKYEMREELLQILDKENK